MSKVIYNYDPDSGAITRDDEHVATLDEATNVVAFEEGHNSLTLPISKFLKTVGQTGCAYEKFTDDAPAVEEIISEASTLDPMPPEPEPAPTLNPVEPTSLMSSDPSIPPRPKYNPRLGDKTPEVVAWYRKYHRQEYIRRYGIIKFDVEFPTHDPVTGEQTGTVTKDLGTRKCDTIEKTQGRSDDTENDWSLVGPTVAEGT